MAVKFQFQFAGVDFSRPSSPHRKWLRVGLYAMASILTALAYWAYLHHLTHGGMPIGSRILHVAPMPVMSASAKPSATLTPASTTPLASKKVAADTLLALGSYLIQAVKMAPAVPVATAVPSAPAKPMPMAVVEPISYTAPGSVSHRPLRVRTDQERLALAGQTAFANMMDLANKYPDAYGFEAEDFLSDAKLGEPLPVYTISDSDRANYQAGQPVKSMLKPAKQWVFPVLMGDRLCCMVQVQQTGHEYVPGRGNKSLAMAWAKIMEKWPAEEGYHPLLVVNPDIPGYYFTVPELPQPNLTDTIEMFYLHPGISPADVILTSWR